LYFQLKIFIEKNMIPGHLYKIEILIFE